MLSTMGVGSCFQRTFQLCLAPIKLLLYANLLQLFLVRRGHKLFLSGKLIILVLALTLKLDTKKTQQALEVRRPRSLQNPSTRTFMGRTLCAKRTSSNFLRSLAACLSLSMYFDCASERPSMRRGE